jgi:hypothetical protein
MTAVRPVAAVTGRTVWLLNTCAHSRKGPTAPRYNKENKSWHKGVRHNPGPERDDMKARLAESIRRRKQELADEGPAR